MMLRPFFFGCGWFTPGASSVNNDKFIELNPASLHILPIRLMKRTLLFLLLAFSITGAFGQALSANNLFSLAAYPIPKSDNYLARNGFALAGKTTQSDTLLRFYRYKRTKHVAHPDSIFRSITRTDIKDATFITFETESFNEFKHIAAELKNEGFICKQELQAIDTSEILFQNKDKLVRACLKIVEDSIRTYSLMFHKKIFPKAKDIYYADDLLAFTSHEYLVHYFGESNVKRDIYFFSGNEIAKCSVLFLNTNRQVVFIWADEENRCTISSLLFGGQQNLQSSIESGKYVEENNWALKSGVRPGMSLMELRMLNGTDFRFYGGNSPNSGSIIPGDSGKLNFKKEEIILACLNCKDDKFTMAKIINADDSIVEGRILFVLSVILNPM